MFSIDNIIFLVGFIVLTTLGLFFIQRFHTSRLKKFELTIAYLGGISAVLITYNIYINMQSNDRIEENRMAYNTLENITRSWLLPQKELLEFYPEGYSLYASMNQDTDLKDFEPKQFDPAKRKQLEVVYSIKVFQIIEDFQSFAKYDITGAYVWINNFLMWLQSPILQHYWKILSFNFSDDTRALVPRIVEKANYLVELRKKNGTLTNNDYDAISKNFEFKPR